jgi:hypothetical protein
MAMGLGFLGRESGIRSTTVGLLHVFSAAAGGALVGAGLGFAGELAGIDGAAQLWVLGITGVAALAIAVRPRPMNLGRPCQVPQRWSKTMPAARLYGVWGLMLGSGVVTLIPYSAHLVLLAAQFAAGPALGAISGGLYGFVRESASLAGVRGRLQPGPAMDALERWAGPARGANIAAVLLGGAGLIAASL